jgi:hypothetical protein
LNGKGVEVGETGCQTEFGAGGREAGVQVGERRMGLGLPFHVFVQPLREESPGRVKGERSVRTPLGQFELKVEK